jgi:hypothetical protein
MRLPTVCFRHVGSDAVADLCIRRPFFPSSTFFSGYFCTFLCSLPVLHCARSRSGGVRCVVFYKHDLAFVPFSFFHPLHVGEQSVEYPQWVISIQRTKAIAVIVLQLTPSCLQPNLLSSLTMPWYLGAPAPPLSLSVHTSCAHLSSSYSPYLSD